MNIKKKFLSDIALISTGSSNTNESVENGKYPFFVRSQEIKLKNDFEYDETAIITSGDGVGVGKVLHYIEGKYALHQRAYRIVIKDKTVIPKFIFYYLQNNLYKYLLEKSYNGSVTSVRLKMINNLPVEIPPIEKQREIIEILDNFQDLISTLKAELELREKQFQYYVDIIYNQLEDKYGLVYLKDIAVDFYKGFGIKKDELDSEGIPCIRYGDIYTDYNIFFKKVNHFISSDYNKNNSLKKIKKNDLLFTITGEKVEEIGKSIAYLGDKEILVGSDILVLKHKEDALYLSLMLSSKQVKRQKSKGKVKAKVVHTNQKSLEKVSLPLPPKNIQKKVSDNLIYFLDLINNLKEEISLREKQYEYYRDRLLDFGDSDE